MRTGTALALALAALFAPATSHAQTPAAVIAPIERTLPLVSLSFEPALASEDPWALAGVHRGDPLDDALARELLRRALLLGTFAEARLVVREVEGGYAVTIRGARRFRAAEVLLRDVRQRRPEEVRSEFGVLEGSWITDDDRVNAQERLQNAYRQAGYRQAVVTTAWAQPMNAAAAVLEVRVNEGRPTEVHDLILRGVPDELVEGVRDDSARALGRSGLADQRRLEPLDTAVTASMRRAGHLDARVLVRSFAPTPGESNSVDAVLVVEPGPAYRVQWSGVRWVRRVELTRALRVEDERSADAATLTVLANRARDFYVQRGFLDARVRVELVREDAEHSVLHMRVTEGELMRVREVTYQSPRENDGSRRLLTVDARVLQSILDDTLLESLPGGEIIQAPRSEIENMFDQGGNSLGNGGDRPSVRLDPRHTYVPDVYAEAARRMTTRYRENGYLDATVEAPAVTRDQPSESRTLAVAFTVREGPRTLLDEVRFEGNEAVSSRDLTGASEVRIGSALTYAGLDAARTRILEHYRERGYTFARVESAVDRSPDRAHGRVRFVIHEGPLVRVGRVLVRGNERTAVWSIIERLTLVPGDVYLPAEVRLSQRAIGELGYFSSVTVGFAEPELEAAVKDLVIEVAEITPTVEVRGGFSSGEGLRVGFSYTDRNVRRTGLSLTVNGTGGMLLPLPFFVDPVFRDNLNSVAPYRWLRGRLGVSIAAPAIPRVGRYARTALDLNVGRVIERQFAINSGSVGVSTTVRPVAAFTIVPAVELQYNNLELLNIASIADVIARAQRERPGDVQRLSRVLLLPQGTTTLFSARVTASLDLRDQVFNPQRGAYFTFTAEYVHPVTVDLPELAGGITPPAPARTLRGIASASGYVPIPFPGGNPLVWATNVRVGLNYNVENDPCKVTYPNRQFFLGGADTMRGWLQDSFIPQDVLPVSRFGQRAYPSRCSSSSGTEGETPYEVPLSQLGGDFYMLWRNELRIPFGSSAMGVIFLDLGNLWKDLYNVSFVVRGAVGFGIRYVSPIGLVGIDVGFNLFAAPNDVSVSRFGGNVLGYQVNSHEIPFAASFAIGGI